jgi:hypothetical protein
VERWQADPARTLLPVLGTARFDPRRVYFACVTGDMIAALQLSRELRLIAGPNPLECGDVVV